MNNKEGLDYRANVMLKKAEKVAKRLNSNENSPVHVEKVTAKIEYQPDGKQFARSVHFQIWSKDVYGYVTVAEYPRLKNKSMVGWGYIDNFQSYMCPNPIAEKDYKGALKTAFKLVDTGFLLDQIVYSIQVNHNKKSELTEDDLDINRKVVESVR